jgi:hypothetical protein
MKTLPGHARSYRRGDKGNRWKPPAPHGAALGTRLRRAVSAWLQDSAASLRVRPLQHREVCLQMTEQVIDGLGARSMARTVTPRSAESPYVSSDSTLRHAGAQQ